MSETQQETAELHKLLREIAAQPDAPLSVTMYYGKAVGLHLRMRGRDWQYPIYLPEADLLPGAEWAIAGCLLESLRADGILASLEMAGNDWLIPTSVPDAIGRSARLAIAAARAWLAAKGERDA